MAKSDDLLNEITKDRKTEVKTGISGVGQLKESGFLPYLLGAGATAGAGAYVSNKLDKARMEVLEEIKKARENVRTAGNRTYVTAEGKLAVPVGTGAVSPSGLTQEAYDYKKRVEQIKAERLAEKQRAEGTKGRAKQQTLQAEKYGEKIPRQTPAVKVRYGKGDFGRTLILNEISRINEMPATTKADMLARQKAVLDLMNNPMFEDARYQDLIDEQVKRRGVLPQAAKPRINTQVYPLTPTTSTMTAEQAALEELKNVKRSLVGRPATNAPDIGALVRNRAFPRLFPAPVSANRPVDTRTFQFVVPETGETFPATVGSETKVVGPNSMPITPKTGPMTIGEILSKGAGKVYDILSNKWVGRSLVGVEGLVNVLNTPEIYSNEQLALASEREQGTKDTTFAGFLLGNQAAGSARPVVAASIPFAQMGLDYYTNYIPSMLGVAPWSSPARMNQLVREQVSAYPSMFEKSVGRPPTVEEVQQFEKDMANTGGGIGFGL